MEEKRAGQAPEADRPAGDPQQNRAARPGGEARGGLSPTERDRQLLREADARGAASARALEDEGFGHKDVTGKLSLDRQE